jgi:hypothetical protein
MFTATRPPSTLLPLVPSLAALALVLGHAALIGVVHQPDEGAAAHVFQLLIAAQVPLLALFVAKWLHRAPRQVVKVLALQAAIAIAACSAVYLTT